MARINLVPTRLEPENASVRLAETLKKINLFGFIILVSVSLILVAYSVFLSIAHARSQSRQKSLKEGIGALSQVETNYTLLKDRVSFAMRIYDKESAFPMLEKIEVATSNLGKEVKITSLALSKGQSNIELAASSKEGFGKTLANFSLPDLYKKVVMNSLTFSLDAGYAMSFSTSEK